ncbi:ABC transporter substrate-binding protein [Conexibacter stalactiti]|uniref:ABC transporter substrate-binding protein n=1 Tax=Conexibacter stalactiti TaxID=1940611 RepID=A0ABU4HLV5_9ACTN|nr:ABC transporter substrate-binding protein [Conexibacter stalactiti]MDW5594272.1 ABC transporter substrate-binding protein [Conexibacter stalactiti]MEC5034914.1 ABC transporter substrate-binding protein [Conexibacter stalactiti]
MTRPDHRRLPGALLLGLAALISALVLAACGGSSENGETAAADKPAAGATTAEETAAIRRGGTLVISAVDPGTAIDPLTTASPAGTAIADAVAEKLTRITTEGTAEPILAESWEPAADGLSWTFRLRPGVAFQDGRPLTSADVVASYERLLARDSPAPGKSAFADLVRGVRADGPETVVFELTRPFSDFPVLTAGSNAHILPVDYRAGTWQRRPVGSGPFRLDLYSPGQSARFSANPNWWNRENLHLGALDLKLYKDQQARVLALQSGEIDSLIGEPVDASLTAALDRSQFQIESLPTAGFTAFALRVDRAPFDDVRVRQAIAWGLDREAIVRTVFGGEGQPGNDTIYGPTYAIKPQGLEQRRQDVAKAEELLGGKEVSFEITGSAQSETLATVIQQQLNEIRGFDVKIKSLPAAEYYADGDDSPWLTAPATLTFWGDRPSPSQYNNFLYARASDWNASQYSNPELERLSAQYDASTDEAERQRAVDAIAQIEWEEAPVIVPAFGTSQSFTAKKVHGLRPQPAAILYSGVWVD